MLCATLSGPFWRGPKNALELNITDSFWEKELLTQISRISSGDKPTQTSTAATTGPSSSFDKKALEDMVFLLESLPEEPIAAWMRSQGFPCDQYVLVLPEIPEYADIFEGPFGKFRPDYVRTSPFISQPLFAKRLTIR